MLIHSPFTLLVFQGSRGDPGDAGPRGEPGNVGPKVRLSTFVSVVAIFIDGVSIAAVPCFDSLFYRCSGRPWKSWL